MIDFLVGVLVTVAAVVVVRRLVGIRHGRWATTLIAVLIANAAAVEMLRLLYGSLREALLRWPKPGRGGPTTSDEYQITRASSVNASASRAEGGTSVPRS
jgi:hypothetical protein